MHLLRWTIGSKKLALLFHPIRGKGKPIVIHSHEFPRALRRLHVISSSFDWLILLTSLPLMIGQSGYFGFRFTALNKKNQKYFMPLHCT